MKQFSFNRFWQLLLSYLADNKKRLMILGGGLFAATIVLFTVGMLAGSTATVGKANVIGKPLFDAVGGFNVKHHKIVFSAVNFFHFGLSFL